MTEGFDFESWLEEAHSGLKALRAKKECLLIDQETIKVSLMDIDKEIAALETMLKSHVGVVPDQEKPTTKTKKTVGIKKAARAIAESMVIGVFWTEDQYVSMVQERIPAALDHSCRCAIQSLAKDGVLIQHGNRGARSYSTTIGRSPDAAEEPAEEPPAPEQGVLPNLPEVTVEDVIAALGKEMSKRSTFPVGEKNIGWIAADLHCDPKVVRDALKVMVDSGVNGHFYEFAYDGEKKVLRHQAKPGSKNELKRTPISDRPLFPGADRPPHA